MARSKVTALGIDLFGVERAVLSIKSDRKGVSVISGGLEELAPSDLVGGVAPASEHVVSRLINSKSAGISNATVGVNEMTGKAEFTRADISSVDRMLSERRKYASSIKGLPARQGKVDAPVVAVIPVPNRRDKKWDPFTAAVRPQLVVAAVDALQAVVPQIRPAIDLRTTAALRAFLGSSINIASDYAAFVHVDALDLTTVLLSRGEVSFIQRSAGGMLGITRNLAASSGRTLENAWATLNDDGLVAFGDDGRHEVWSLVDMEVRGLDARLKTMWEAASAKSVEREDAPRIESVYLSGPIADDEVAVDMDLGGGIAVYAFRPVAQLSGATPEIVRHAGRFTVAFGHALNSIALAGSSPDRNALATDLTPLIELDILPASLRSESGMPQAAEPPRTSNRNPTKSSRPSRQLSHAAQQRIVAAMYLGGLGLLGATALPMVQRSQMRKGTAELRRKAQAMSASVFEDSTKLEQFRTSFRKAGSLDALRELAATPHQQLAGLARAASMSNGNVWLMRVESNIPGTMAVYGRSESLSSFASYFSALRSDPAFATVTYAITNGVPVSTGAGGIAPTDTAGTFPFTVTLTLKTPTRTGASVGPLETVLQGAVPHQSLTPTQPNPSLTTNGRGFSPTHTTMSTVPAGE
jgi:hypothetical protein